MIKSPLRYPGGKSRSVKLISSLIPDSFNEYREPFLGGGSVFLYLKQTSPGKSFWVNDLYAELYEFWKHSQIDVNEIITEVVYLKNMFPDDGKSLHRFLINNIDSFNGLGKAAAFFIFNRITFSGTSESGGYSDESYHKRFTESSVDRLRLIGDLMKDTKITNLDFQDVIQQEGDDVFLFLDPPYYSAMEKSALYGKNGSMHKGFDHERLATVLKDCKHKWLMTYDDCQYIRDLYSNFAHIISWDLSYGMKNVTKDSNQIGKELFISNYRTEIPEASKHLATKNVF